MENCSTRMVPLTVGRSVTPSKVSHTCERLAVICSDGFWLTTSWSPGATSGTAGQVADGLLVGAGAVVVVAGAGLLGAVVGVAGVGEGVGLADGDGESLALGEAEGSAPTSRPSSR